MVVVVVINRARRCRRQVDSETAKRPMLYVFQMHELDYESLHEESEGGYI